MSGSSVCISLGVAPDAGWWHTHCSAAHSHIFHRYRTFVEPCCGRLGIDRRATKSTTFDASLERMVGVFAILPPLPAAALLCCSRLQVWRFHLVVQPVEITLRLAAPFISPPHVSDFSASLHDVASSITPFASPMGSGVGGESVWPALSCACTVSAASAPALCTAFVTLRATA